MVYLLDPNYSFAIANNVVENLSNGKILQKAILVGIGYDDNDIHQEYVGYDSKKFSTYKLNRVRDYTPIKKSQDSKSYSHEYDQYSGNAEKFKQVIVNEILPDIGKMYRVNGNNTILGHSYGGLFVIWLYLNDNQIFNSYIAISPSLWYENNWILSSLKDRKIDHLKKLYISVGAKESERMLKGFRLIKHELKNPNLKSEILKNEGHTETVPISIVHGLKFVLGEQSEK